jgi:hypothetical protein
MLGMLVIILIQFGIGSLFMLVRSPLAIVAMPLGILFMISGGLDLGSLIGWWSAVVTSIAVMYLATR